MRYSDVNEARAPAEAAVGLRQLNERSREIFKRIVEAYLATGEPVGSRNLSRTLPMTLSPASVRNVMSDLEGLDLIYAPHTSAGRLPTHTGLRLFIDGLLEIGDISNEERSQIESRIVGSGRPLLAESSLSPTSPPASAIRSSRSKARSSDCTPPLEPAGLESDVLAWDGGTAPVLSKRRARQQLTGLFPIGPLLPVRRPCRSGPCFGRVPRPGPGPAPFRSPKLTLQFAEVPRGGSFHRVLTRSRRRVKTPSTVR